MKELNNLRSKKKGIIIVIILWYFSHANSFTACCNTLLLITYTVLDVTNYEILLGQYIYRMSWEECARLWENVP